MKSFKLHVQVLPDHCTISALYTHLLRCIQKGYDRSVMDWIRGKMALLDYMSNSTCIDVSTHGEEREEGGGAFNSLYIPYLPLRSFQCTPSGPTFPHLYVTQTNQSSVERYFCLIPIQTGGNPCNIVSWKPGVRRLKTLGLAGPAGTFDIWTCGQRNYREGMCPRVVGVTSRVKTASF